MKKQIIFFTFSLISINVLSQELTTSGQSYLKFFRKSIEKLDRMDAAKVAIYSVEIDKAKNNLNSLKNTDPNFDQSTLINELKVYEDKLVNIKTQHTTDLSKSQAIIDDLDLFLKKDLDEYLNNGKSPNINGLESVVSEFEQNFSNFCTNELATPSIKSKAIRKAEDGWNFDKKDPTHISSMENYSGREENSDWAVFNYYYMRLIYARWSNLSKTFPESKVLSGAAQQAENAYKKVGNKEVATKNALKAKEDHLAKIKMDPATASDPALEAQIKKAMANTTFGEGRTVLKINLHNKDWNIKRNQITGIILSRSKNFSAVVKEKDGTCTLIRYTSYKQDYDGNNYGNGYVYMGQADKILCENVNK
ncbi:MAG: hypothetical protein Q8L81_14795 [Bacteroidota bacterium]|nr:hypothetical protein [Bacteroidota bacterium]